MAAEDMAVEGMAGTDTENKLPNQVKIFHPIVYTPHVHENPIQ